LDQYWIERGWPIEDIKDKKKEKFSTNSLQFYLDKGYSKEEANDLYKKRKEMQSKNSLKTKKLTGKYGGYSLDKFIKSGMSESDAKLKLNKIKISKSVSMKKVWDKSESYNERILPQNKEWWINLGYSEEEAVNQVSKIQTTFSLKICIEKYGEIKGREVFDKRQKKWQRSLFEGGNMKVGYSRISQQLFDKIHEKFSDNKVNYATLNKEFIIYNKEKKEVYAYDYVDRTTKRVIEYNGDLFHANPSTYNEYDTPHPYSDITAKDLWDKDRTKLELIKKYGFKVLVVWDSDYRTNPEKEIKKCMNFLLNI